MADTLKTYSVTLAQLGWIKGTMTVKADSFDAAFKRAKLTSGFPASWPVDEDGDEVRGFGDIEIDSAYCEEDDEHHEGEAPAADVAVYKAAPALLALLKEAVDAWPQFDCDDEVNGGDLVEWFGEWRAKAKALTSI